MRRAWRSYSRSRSSPGRPSRTLSPWSRPKRHLSRPSWVPNRQKGVFQGRVGSPAAATARPFAGRGASENIFKRRNLEASVSTSRCPNIRESMAISISDVSGVEHLRLQGPRTWPSSYKRTAPKRPVEDRCPPSLSLPRAP